MRIHVKLFATLRERGPEGLDIGEAFTVSLKENSTVNDLLNYLGITIKEAKIIMINHNSIMSYDEPLHENDEISIFPPVGGG